MWLRRGWLLNTLNYQIEKNLRESIYKNEAFRENRWNIIEHHVLQWSAAPIKYVLLLAVAFLLNMICIHMWLHEIQQLVPHWRQPLDEMIKWQGTFLGGQLTIIGLIFPLVAGFVGVLLGSKSASRALWHIYSHHSGFMFVGLSGLMLSAFIVLGQLVHPWLWHSIEVVLSIGVSFWLLFNIACSGWFLYATFRFIATDNRNNLILRYCVNETLIAEIAARLSQLLPRVAIETGLLPENKEDEEIPQVNTFGLTNDVKTYEISFKRRKYLKNIRFRLLSVYVRFWKQTTSQSATGNKAPSLVLPVADKTQAYKKWMLARSNSLAFSRLDGFFLRRCYVFSIKPSIRTTDMQPVIHALVGNIEDALREDNIRQFELAMRDMEHWHTSITDAAAFINDNGEWDNWLLLSNGALFGNSLLDELSHEYFEISRSVTQYLPKSTRYFEIISYFYLRIYGYKNRQLAGKVVNKLIEGHYSVWIALVNWHKNVDAPQQDTVLSQQYESALSIFVGSWEGWCQRRMPLENYEWPQSKQAVEPYIHHLEYTARQIVAALRHKELAAAEWAADMLVYWYDNAFIGREPHQYGWRKMLLVHTELGGDVTESIWKKILNGQELNYDDAIHISLSNAWFDMRLVTAAYILMKPTDEISPRIKILITSLVDETRLRPSGGLDFIYHRINSGAKILETYIRQRSYWKDGDNTYDNWLDSVVRSFGKIEAPEHVSGRVYSGWGAADIRHLQSAYMAIAISKSSCEWALSDQMLEFIFSDCVEIKHRESLVSDLNAWITPTDDVIEKSKILLGDAYQPEMLENYKNSISKLIERINSQTKIEILQAPKDKARLIQFGKYASETAFTMSTGRIPLALFNDIEFVDNMDDVNKYSVNIGGYERSNVAEGLKPSRAANEEDLLDNIIAQSVPTNLFKCLIHSTNFVENRFDDGMSLIKSVVDDARALAKEGYTPVLFIGPWNVYDLLDSALWKYRGNKDELPFAVRKDDGYADNYLCHLENIEVYRMPFSKIRYSILTAKEYFELVTFRRIDDGQYVEVEFEEDEKDPTKGTLKLSYWMQTKFKDKPAYKYVSTSEKE